MMSPASAFRYGFRHPAAPVSHVAAWARGSIWPAAFAINGRFLSQAVTGVQRYGREIVRAIDRLALERGLLIDLLLPCGVDPPADIRALRPRGVGIVKGHVWEQTVMPLHRPRLLSLCNTAPILGRGGVLCIHDANVFEVPDSYSPEFRRFYTILHPLLVRSGAQIATVSHHAADRIAHHLRIDASSIIVAGDGHEHALAWDAKQATVRPGERPFILIIGSLARHKNTARVLEIAAELDDRGLDVLVAGVTGTVFSASAAAQSANVRYLGRITDDDLAFLLGRAFCLAFPSLSEGFGLPMLEAMVWGCPVIASRATSLPEVGGDACLYADADNGASWLAQVDRLRGTPGLADELRVKGRARARRFSWAHSAALYVDLMT